MAAPLLFVCVMFALRGASVASQAHIDLTFMMIASYGQHGFNSSGALPAVDMALEDINSDPDILSGYNLTYDKVRDSMVSISFMCLSIIINIFCTQGYRTLMISVLVLWHIIIIILLLLWHFL